MMRTLPANAEKGERQTGWPGAGERQHGCCNQSLAQCLYADCFWQLAALAQKWGESLH
jgi:hypothetical protein